MIAGCVALVVSAYAVGSLSLPAQSLAAANAPRRHDRLFKPGSFKPAPNRVLVGDGSGLE